MKTTTDGEGQARKLAAKQLATDMLGQPCPALLSCGYRNEKAANVQLHQDRRIRLVAMLGVVKLHSLTS